MYKTLSAALAALSLASAQQVGTNTAEVHPALSVQSCTKSGGCTTLQRSIVLDANWRWLHSTSGYTNCYTGQTWDATLCPDAATCAKNCAVDGADYSGTYGISTSGNAATLGFVTKGSGAANIGSRVYLMQDASTYQSFNLLNGEFTFDVDVANLPCGLNGALYFSQMDADGGLAKQPNNKAGAKYGTGYCDAQCPKDLKFIGGVANNVGWTGSSSDANSGTGLTGSCCDEMDIWEANSQATAFTPHPCSSVGLSACTGAACSSTCDQAGCDFNSWRMGNETFYGPGLTIDTKSKITVVTQFITDDNTKTGNLVRINRFYVQNNKLIPNSYSEYAGIDSVNYITDNFCAQQKSVFGDNNDTKAKGGLKKMGDAFKRGMVLVMSIWDDHVANALWLDSDYPVGADSSKPGVSRGPCSTSSGVPADVEVSAANSKVTYSNIKWGDLNSTFTYTGVVGGGSGGGNPPVVSSSTNKPTSTPVTIRTSSTTVKTTSAAAPTNTGATAPKYGQCGGQGWTGPTVCAAGSTCKVSNQYYSQCL